MLNNIKSSILNLNIKTYQKDRDEELLMKMIEDEGDEWADYTAENVSGKYKLALENSITYVAYLASELCGYSRSINDNDFYIFVCDLLVAPKFRGHNIGRLLMDCIKEDFPDFQIFVMSDVDEYYQKLGYKREGTLFEVGIQ